MKTPDFVKIEISTSNIAQVISELKITDIDLKQLIKDLVSIHIKPTYSTYIKITSQSLPEKYFIKENGKKDKYRVKIGINKDQYKQIESVEYTIYFRDKYILPSKDAVISKVATAEVTIDSLPNDNEKPKRKRKKAEKPV